MSAEESPEQGPTLEDVFAMVGNLGMLTRMGRMWRKTALALADVDLNQVGGLVIDGDVVPARWVKEYAACACKNGLHRFTRDGWFGRSGWTDVLSEAEARKDKVRGHIVTQTVITTNMEVVQ